MKLLTGFKLLWRRFFSRDQDARQLAGFLLAEKFAAFFHRTYRFSEYGRTWLGDEEFFRAYERLGGTRNYHSADRKFFLRSLLGLARELPGDTAECGAYAGASSYFICRAMRDAGKTHHVFDSFEGLPEPSEHDGRHWKARDLALDESVLRRNLEEFDFVRVHKGWIPDTFPAVAERTFCFVHVDVDLYAPTREALAFFYQRLVPGGVLLLDDYGFRTCPGVRRATDEFVCDKEEALVHVPTGQAFLVKGPASRAQGQ